MNSLSRIAGALVLASAPALASFAPSKPEPLKMPNGFQFSTNNYPVTVCGGISATAKDPGTSEFVLRNGTIELYLYKDKVTDVNLLRQFRSLIGIFPRGNVAGCLSSRELPASDQNGRMILDVEVGAITIAGD